MTVYDSLFPLGFGTNRFLCKGAGDTEEIEAAAELMARAMDAGISYVDVANTYSKGTAEAVCRRAFQLTSAPRNVTVKSSFMTDTLADDALRRVDTAFEHMGIDHASYFVLWNIASYEMFEKIMAKGALYEGAAKAKERGLVEHICFSTHAPPDEIVRMIESGAFEGVTISFNVLNAQIMKPVLNCAEKHRAGVVVMNPLAGGLIPQNGDYYSFLCGSKGETTVQAALRYVYGHPAVKIVLSGMGTLAELEENLGAFTQPDPESAMDRIERVDGHFHRIEGFCTGCRYCDGCPKGVPVYELMQSYNTRLFPRAEKQYGRTDPELLETIGVCSRLKNTFGLLPETAENPCVACGRCESRCTAHLPIIQRLESLYDTFSEACFSKEGMLARLRQVIGQARRVAFYPGGGYTAFVLELLREAFPNTDFELSLFDSNPGQWGSVVAGVVVRTPEEIPEIHPEVIIVSNFNFGDEIYRSLEHWKTSGIRVEELHRERDVPWVF